MTDPNIVEPTPQFWTKAEACSAPAEIAPAETLRTLIVDAVRQERPPFPLIAAYLNALRQLLARTQPLCADDDDDVGIEGHPGLRRNLGGMHGAEALVDTVQTMLTNQTARAVQTDRRSAYLDAQRLLDQVAPHLELLYPNEAERRAVVGRFRVVVERSLEHLERVDTLEPAEDGGLTCI